MAIPQSPAAAPPRALPMSPQLRYILLQAKQLPPTEQLQLISHLVHHRLPIQLAPERSGQAIATEVSATERSATEVSATERSAIPDTVALPDPQLLEFSAEILEYQQELTSMQFES